MKKITSFALCNLILISIVMAVPHPKYKKNSKARIAHVKPLPPKPSERFK